MQKLKQEEKEINDKHNELAERYAQRKNVDASRIHQKEQQMFQHFENGEFDLYKTCDEELALMRREHDARSAQEEAELLKHLNLVGKWEDNFILMCF